MKFFIAFALFALAAARPGDDIEIDKPVNVGPAIVDESHPENTDEYQPPHVDPVLIEEEQFQPPHAEPAYIEDFNPALEDASPLVQIVVNVANAVNHPNPVAVEGLDEPEPAPTPVLIEDEPYVPEPVIVADHLPIMPVAIPDDILNLN